MSPDQVRTIAIAVTIVVAPGALIFIIMVLRSYTIDINVHRDVQRRRHVREQEDDDE